MQIIKTLSPPSRIIMRDFYSLTLLASGKFFKKTFRFADHFQCFVRPDPSSR